VGRRLTSSPLTQASLTQLSRARAAPHARPRGTPAQPSAASFFSLTLTAWRAHAGSAGRVASGGPAPHALVYFTPRRAHSTRPFLPSTLQRHSTIAAHAAHRHRAPSPELAIPSVLAHRRPLHRATSTASPSRTRCSLRHTMVSLHAGATAHQSSVVAHGAHCSVELAPPLHPSHLFQAQLHCTTSPMPVSSSPRRDMAGDGSPPGSSSAAPPLAMASLFLSSSGHAVCTNVTALAR
jgi:hypothetical protein